MKSLQEILDKTNKFEEEAHRIFSKHEGTKSGTVTLTQTQKRLTCLSLKQNELLQEAIKSIKNELYRGAYVLAWAAFIDFLEEKLASDGLVKVKQHRPNWSKFKTIEELRENVPEFQLIDVAHDVNLLTKAETKTIQGLLSKRNECAHPSSYTPRFAESLGYLDEIFNRIEQIQKRNM